LTDDVLKKFKQQIDTWTMIPSDGGRFEILADGKLIFSKLEQKRFPSNDEVIGLIEKELTKIATA